VVEIGDIASWKKSFAVAAAEVEEVDILTEDIGKVGAKMASPCLVLLRKGL